MVPLVVNWAGGGGIGSSIDQYLLWIFLSECPLPSQVVVSYGISGGDFDFIAFQGNRVVGGTTPCCCSDERYLRKSCSQRALHNTLASVTAMTGVMSHAPDVFSCTQNCNKEAAIFIKNKW